MARDELNFVVITGVKGRRVIIHGWFLYQDLVVGLSWLVHNTRMCVLVFKEAL